MFEVSGRGTKIEGKNSHENTESDKTPGTFPGIRILLYLVPIRSMQTWQMESGGARVALNVGGDIVAVERIRCLG